MKRTAVLAAAALALVLCGGCRDHGVSEPQQGTSQFDQVEATLASIEADVNRP